MTMVTEADSVPSEEETGVERFDRIYCELRDRICLLTYPPGTVLSETALAKEFGITNVAVLDVLAAADPGFIPVVSPISVGTDGASYNVNADTAAGVLSGALGASRLMLLTDIEGVKDKDGSLLTDLSVDDAKGLIADGTATGGMIPKLGTAIEACTSGVEAVVILDGRRSHGLLVELFTGQGAGTLIS